MDYRTHAPLAHSWVAHPLQALAWYRRAADQGLGFAQNSLGNMYHDGQGVPQNYAQALAWFRMAAEQSHRKTSGNKLRSRVLGRHRLRRNPLPERKYP